MIRSFAVSAGLSFAVSSTVNEKDNKSLSRNQKLGLLVLAVVGAACWLITVWGVIRNFSSTALLDLRVYRDAIELWRTQGQNPYGVYVTEWKLPFTYPPFAILALLPFSLMNFKAAAKTMVQSGFSGWYLRVIKTGAVQAGDKITVLPGSRQISIENQNQTFYRLKGQTDLEF